MQKNVASQSITVLALDTGTGLPKTGDAGNITLYYNGDGGGVTVFSTGSGVPSEDDATNAPGCYTLALTQGETNYNRLNITGKSSTSGVRIIPILNLQTVPAAFALAAGTAGGLHIIGTNAGGIIYTGGAVQYQSGLYVGGPAYGLWLDSAADKALKITTSAGDAVSVAPTAGHGINIAANGTSKHGILLTGGTGGTSDGIKAVAGTGGVDIRGNITGNLVGTVSTLTTYTGNTVQTGDAYAVVSDSSFGNAKLVRSTTPANTLTVDSSHLVAVPDTQKVDLNTIKTQAVTCAAGVTVSPFVGSTGAAVNGTNANTLSGHDPGATLGTSTLTQAQVSGGAYALNSASFAFNAAHDFTSTQKTSIGAAVAASAVASVTAAVTVTGDLSATMKSSVQTATDAAVTANATVAEIGADVDELITSVAAIPTNPYTGTPPTAAAIATAVLTSTAGGDLGTSGSLGYIAAHQLAGAFTSASSSVFTVGALANAPSGGGGSGTVTGYASGQDPATLILGAVAASWNSAGTIGQKINAAGGAADPLTNDVPGTYAAGTAGAALGKIGAGQVNATSAVAQSGAAGVIRGNDYTVASGSPLPWSSTAWPNLATATVQLQLFSSFAPGAAPAFTKAGTVTASGGSTQSIRVELTAADTLSLTAGDYLLRILATIGGASTPLVSSTLAVIG